MKLIKDSAYIIDEADPLKQIERIARVCYKSEDSITDVSALTLIQKLVKNEHEAMIEHSVFVLNINDKAWKKIRELPLDTLKFFNMTDYSSGYIISGSARSFKDSYKENQSEHLLSIIKYLAMFYPVLFHDMKLQLGKRPAISKSSEKYVKILTKDEINSLDPKEYALHKYTSIGMICDRGVSHEVVRCRIASYAQESTRYCNYGKDKFGNEITFIDIADGFGWDLSDPKYYKGYNLWKGKMVVAEDGYLELISMGFTPQEARSVLNNSLKTEIIMTANDKEWKHFFKLRVSLKAHPQMMSCAKKAKALYLGEGGVL